MVMFQAREPITGWKFRSKAVWVPLFLALMWGTGWSAVRAGQDAARRPVLHLRFKPEPGGHPGQLEGTVTLSAQGALAGALIKVPPDAEIVLERPPNCQEPDLADLHLTGATREGHPLPISSRPQPEESSGIVVNELSSIEPAVEEIDAASAFIPQTRKATRRWFGFILICLGIVVSMTAAFLFWHDGRNIQEEIEAEDSPKSNLRLEAQVEALIKEKAQLQAALAEKASQVTQLLAEKTDLQADLERAREKSQDNRKHLEELEEKLKRAEREAAGVQQEYVALYARSQQETATFKKE